MFEWISSMLGVNDNPDTSAATLATNKASAAMNNALLAQYGAIEDTRRASDTYGESNRLASEGAMKRLAAGAMFGAGGMAPTTNNVPTFTRELFGS